MPKTKAPATAQPEKNSLTGDDSEFQIVSFSELDTYRQCPLKHLLAYKNRYTKPQPEGSALSRGSLYHNVMQAHYETLRDLQQLNGGKPLPLGDEQDALKLCLQAVAPWLVNPETGDQSEDQELVQWMYEGYVEQYGTDRQWLILEVEEKVELALPRADGSPSNFKIKARLDLVVLEVRTGLVWIVDHKSGKNLPNQMDLEIDDQFGIYTWAKRTEGLNVAGSLHNANRTQRNLGDFPGAEPKNKPQTLDQRMGRRYLNRTAQECENIARDAYAAACNAYPEREGLVPLPLYSSPDPRQCGWKCDFKESHLQARTGADLATVLLDRGFVQDFTRH